MTTEDVQILNRVTTLEDLNRLLVEETPLNSNMVALGSAWISDIMLEAIQYDLLPSTVEVKHVGVFGQAPLLGRFGRAKVEREARLSAFYHIRIIRPQAPDKVWIWRLSEFNWIDKIYNYDPRLPGDARCP